MFQELGEGIEVFAHLPYSITNSPQNGRQAATLCLGGLADTVGDAN
jgi:hypothetical protein